jgi:hypothetical protein
LGSGVHGTVSETSEAGLTVEWDDGIVSLYLFRAPQWGLERLFEVDEDTT